MDGKIIAYVLLLGVAMAVIWGFFYSSDLDEALLHLDSTKAQIGLVEKEIAVRKNRLEARREAVALMQVAGILSSEQDSIREEINNYEKQEAQVTEQFVNEAQRERDQAEGTTLDQVLLSSGRMLKSIRIQSIDDELLVGMHAEGASKIPVEDLPQDLKDRFMIGKLGKKPLPDADAAPSAPSVVIPDPTGSSSKKKSSVSRGHSPAGNIRIEGNPSLWNSVTRTSLGRAYIPGTGWLKIGTKGPIPNMAE